MDHNHLPHHNNNPNSASNNNNNKPMEKPPPQDHPVLPPPPQQVLKCPRCDSTNTKFCYYNNYSLSQPRHFCKACKRYWTRGGTLRNVPVGGGCRKNKRAKRPQPNSDGGASSHVQQPTQIDLSPVSNQIGSSLFYNMGNPLEANFPFSRFSSSRGFDFHQPAAGGFGLGFSSGLLTSHEAQNSSQGRSQEFSQDLQHDPVFLGSAAGSNSTMTSLLASLQQPKLGSSGLMSYDQVRGGNGISNGREMIKMEGENRLDHHHQHQQQHQQQQQQQQQHQQQQNTNQVHHHEQQQMNTSTDPNSSLLWNTSNITSWFDPSSSMGSSVPSLI